MRGYCKGDCVGSWLSDSVVSAGLSVTVGVGVRG